MSSVQGMSVVPLVPLDIHVLQRRCFPVLSIPRPSIAQAAPARFMGSTEAADALAACQPTWLAHPVDHGQWSKPVTKLCRVGTSAAHATFAGD